MYSSDVILKIGFSVGAELEYLATILTADVLPSLLLVTVGDVVLEDLTVYASLMTVSAAELEVLTFNLRLESVQLLYSFVEILLVGLELGAVSKLKIAKPAVGLRLDVSLSSVEPERVFTDELEVAELTGIFQHLLLDTLGHQTPLLRVVFLHMGTQVERFLERLIAKLTLYRPQSDLGV